MCTGSGDGVSVVTVSVFLPPDMEPMTVEFQEDSLYLSGKSVPYVRSKTRVRDLSFSFNSGVTTRGVDTGNSGLEGRRRDKSHP